MGLQDAPLLPNDHSQRAHSCVLLNDAPLPIPPETRVSGRHLSDGFSGLGVEPSGGPPDRDFPPARARQADRKDVDRRQYDDTAQHERREGRDDEEVGSAGQQVSRVARERWSVWGRWRVLRFAATVDAIDCVPVDLLT